jgi:MFS family permease
LFNIGGRIFWASLSDYIGRKNTYYTFFILGIVLYASAPYFAQTGNKALFVLAFGIILSMYGGGFATVPAYLADMFGTQFVGAIHGRLLTAWSTAGIIGPVVVNYIREAQLAAGVPRDHLYDYTMYILCGMLVIGLICNALIKPVAAKWYMSADEVAKLQAASASGAAPSGSFGIGKGGLDLPATIFWLFVGIPLAWGVWQTLLSAIKIF